LRQQARLPAGHRGARAEAREPGPQLRCLSREADRGAQALAGRERADARRAALQTTADSFIVTGSVLVTERSGNADEKVGQQRRTGLGTGIRLHGPGGLVWRAQ